MKFGTLIKDRFKNDEVNAILDYLSELEIKDKLAIETLQVIFIEIGDKMVLINKYKYTKYAERGKYHCDISKFLDEQAGIKKEDRWLSPIFG